MLCVILRFVSDETKKNEKSSSKAGTSKDSGMFEISDHKWKFGFK